MIAFSLLFLGCSDSENNREKLFEEDETILNFWLEKKMGDIGCKIRIDTIVDQNLIYFSDDVKFQKKRFEDSLKEPNQLEFETNNYLFKIDTIKQIYNETWIDELYYLIIFCESSPPFMAVYSLEIGLICTVSAHSYEYLIMKNYSSSNYTEYFDFNHYVEELLDPEIIPVY